MQHDMPECNALALQALITGYTILSETNILKHTTYYPTSQPRYMDFFIFEVSKKTRNTPRQNLPGPPRAATELC